MATLKHNKDKQMAENLRKQLSQLSKQLEAASGEKQLREKLEQAGAKKEDAERMLKNLSKKDLDQLRDQLEKSGMPKKQANKLLEKLAQRQQACNMCKKMSQSMGRRAGLLVRGRESRLRGSCRRRPINSAS